MDSPGLDYAAHTDKFISCSCFKSQHHTRWFSTTEAIAEFPELGGTLSHQSPTPGPAQQSHHVLSSEKHLEIRVKTLLLLFKIQYTA